VLMSVWRTCWQQGRSALDFLSQLLRGAPEALVLPPWATARRPAQLDRRFRHRLHADTMRSSWEL